MTATEVLDNLAARGIRLGARKGKLRWDAPPGAVTNDDVTRLKVFHSELLAMLSAKPPVIGEDPNDVRDVLLWLAEKVGFPSGRKVAGTREAWEQFSRESTLEQVIVAGMALDDLYVKGVGQ